MFLLEEEQRHSKENDDPSSFSFGILLVLKTQQLLGARRGIFVGEAKGYPPVCSAGVLMESAQLSRSVCWSSAHVCLHKYHSPTMSLTHNISAAKYITTHRSLDPEEACDKL